MGETAIKRADMSQRSKVTVLVLSVCLILGAASYWLFVKPSVPPALKEAKANVTFRVYYPHGNPSGYHLKQGSITSGSAVIIFSFTKKGEGDIVTTQQAAPPQFNFQDFYKKQLFGSSTFLTPQGEAVIGRTPDGKAVVSLTKDSTWIIITATEKKVRPQEMQVFTKSLVGVD